MAPHADLPTAPHCLAPSAEMAAAAFEMPAGACDTHAHVISDSADYPMVASRIYTPPPAPEAKYLAQLKATGCTRGVLVQISVYGTDNRYMLEVLGRNPDRLRGVAVVTPEVTDRELESMHANGVRGLRINISFPGGGLSFDAMELLARRIAPMGWHMQFLFDGRDLPTLLPRMRKLPCPGVIDHMGHMPAALGLRHPAFLAMRELAAEHGWWVKLSGAYRLSDDYDGFREVTPLAQALIEAAPERMVWGSDWPHVAMARMPDTGLLRNLLKDWAPDPAVRNRILVDNPARLYDFKTLRSPHRARGRFGKTTRFARYFSQNGLASLMSAVLRPLEAVAGVESAPECGNGGRPEGLLLDLPDMGEAWPR